MTEITKKQILTKFSQVNFRKSHEILDQRDKSIKSYIKMFEAEVELRQVLQTYSEICIFCVLQKKVLQKQLVKIDVIVPVKSCDEIEEDVMKFMLY